MLFDPDAPCEYQVFEGRKTASHARLRKAVGVNRMTMMLCGWFIVFAVAVGCAETSDGTGGSVDKTEASEPAQRVSFGQVEMDLPENWGVYASGNSAVVGILAGGNCDVPLRVEIHYAKGVESLVPTCCPQHWPPVAVTSVRAVESGFRPVGDKTAQFRRFTATCAEQTIERRAWLLPDAKVAIVEQQASPENDRVVRQMRVGTLKDVVFENVTFHVPPSWNIAVDGSTAVLGKLPGGERDSQLAVMKNFTKSVDDLAPKPECPVDGKPPTAAREVVVLESGLRQLDGATADYRKFVVRCADGLTTYTHRGWVLPDSNIAIFENRESPDVDEVDHIVANATVRR
jgi:hypothetical protein